MNSKRDIFYEGKIYAGVIGVNITDAIPYKVVGQHQFKDWEDVTGLYEKQYQWCISGDWRNCTLAEYEHLNNYIRRIVATALPLPASTGEGVKEITDNATTENLEYKDGVIGHKRPPLGIMPLWRHNELRLEDLEETIERYMTDNTEIPQEWVNEKYDLQTWLKNRNNTTQPPSTSGDKNLTAMGDVLELIELRLEDSDPEYCMGLELIRREIYSQNLLAKEREQIIDAYDAGMTDWDGELYKNKEGYYTQTFN